jgi:hypothetical protein
MPRTRLANGKTNQRLPQTKQLKKMLVLVTLLDGRTDLPKSQSHLATKLKGGYPQRKMVQWQ